MPTEALPRAAVPTPSLVLDVDALDRNIARMAERAGRMGVHLRPHVKSHKCLAIARRLAQAGAVGACCATIEEAEVLAAEGIEGLLITSPMSTEPLIKRVLHLLDRGADLMLVVDHAQTVKRLADLPHRESPLKLIVEFDVGVGRTGCPDARSVVALAHQIAGLPSMRFAGVQSYWGNLQQVMPFAERERRVQVQAERLRTLIADLAAAGLPPKIVTGSGTGTHAIDGALGLFTELQPGSFLFLDSCYGEIPLGPDGNPFEPSLFVAASVVSANMPGRAIVNAGLKAFATDSGLPKVARGAPPHSTYRFMGDEHGAVDWQDAEGPHVGDTLELLTSHCDPTVNLHARYQVVRGDRVVDVWPIVARGYGDPGP